MITLRQSATKVTVNKGRFSCPADPGHAKLLNDQEWSVPGWHPQPDHYLAEQAVEFWGGEITQNDGGGVLPSRPGVVY